MIDIYPKYYKLFGCLGGDCSHTCCQGWGVDIDKNTLLRYKNVLGPYGAKLKHIISNHKQFFKVGNTCPFLTKEGLCDIQIHLGEGYLCDVCKKFPRFLYTYGEYVEHGLSNACIEASKLLLTNGLQFDVVKSPAPVETYNHFDSKLLPHLRDAREYVYKVTDTLDINRVFALILDFGEYFQANFRVYSKIDDILSKYKDRVGGYTTKFTDIIDEKKVIKLIKTYMGLEMITPYISNKLDRVLSLIYNHRITMSDIVGIMEKYRKSVEFNYILKNFVYKYYLRSVYDYKMYARLKMCVYTTFIAILLAVDDMYTGGKFDTMDNAKNLEMIAREIEHNEDNIKKLTKYFNKKV